MAVDAIAPRKSTADDEEDDTPAIAAVGRTGALSRGALKGVLHVLAIEHIVRVKKPSSIQVRSIFAQCLLISVHYRINVGGVFCANILS